MEDGNLAHVATNIEYPKQYRGRASYTWHFIA